MFYHINITLNYILPKSTLHKYPKVSTEQCRLHWSSSQKRREQRQNDLQQQKAIFTVWICFNTYFHTAKITIPNFKTNIPRKGIARTQSRFPHSYACEWCISSHDRSAYSTAGKYVDWSWEYINRSHTWMWKSGLRPRNSFPGNT